MRFELDGKEMIGVYRSSSDRELKFTLDDGTVAEIGEVPTPTIAAAIKVARADGQPVDDDGNTTWYTSLQGVPMPTPNDGGKAGDESDGEKHDAGDEAAGDEGDGESGDESDGQGDDAGDGEGEGEGEPMSDEDLEKLMENFDPKNSRTPDGGEDQATGSPIADTIWPFIKPNVEAVAASYAVASAGFAIQNGRPGPAGKPGEPGEGGGSGSGQGRIVVSPGKVGKVEGRTHNQFDTLVRVLARKRHAYLPGPPGTGKSHMVRQAADALSVPFGVTSFSPQSTESKLLGFRNAMGEYVPTVYRNLFEHGGVFCGDELDNSNPAVVAVLNGGLANGYMEFPDGVVERHPDFVFVATANTMGTGPTAEFAGRQKLDPATLNRFVKIFVDTDEEMESGIIADMLSEAQADRWLKKIRHCRRAVAELKIKHYVTMRDSINGAMLIAPGEGKFTELEALEMTVLTVLTDDQKAKIKAFRG